MTMQGTVQTIIDGIDNVRGCPVTNLWVGSSHYHIRINPAHYPPINEGDMLTWNAAGNIQTVNGKPTWTPPKVKTQVRADHVLCTVDGETYRYPIGPVGPNRFDEIQAAKQAALEASKQDWVA